MHCLSCGTALLPNSEKCPTCGTPAPSTSLPSSSSSPYEGMELVYSPVKPVPSVPSVPPASSENSSRLVGILCTIIVLLLLSNVGLLYFALVYQSAQLHREAVSIAQTAETQASATAYASSPQGLYSRYTSGKPELRDALNNSATSIWPDYISINGRNICKFTGGSYHVINTDTDHFSYCYPSFNRQSNFVIQVQMTIIKGDCGGVVVRADTIIGSLYRLRLCPDSTFRFYRYGNFSSASISLLAAGYIPSMHAGFSQSNLITIIAQNSNFYLYVNKQYVIRVDDGMYDDGVIGLSADDISQSTEVVFTNAEIWELP